MLHFLQRKSKVDSIPVSSASPSNETDEGDTRGKVKGVGIATSNFDTAMAMLVSIGEATQDVPYLKTIGGLMIQIVKIKNDVETRKSKCDEIIADVERIQEIVEGFHFTCVEAGKQDDELPEDLKLAFKSLERSVLFSSPGKAN